MIAVSVVAVGAVAAPLIYPQIQTSHLREQNRALEARLQRRSGACRGRRARHDVPPGRAPGCLGRRPTKRIVSLAAVAGPS
jgi:type II secretory pathway component PulJ